MRQSIHYEDKTSSAEEKRTCRYKTFRDFMTINVRRLASHDWSALWPMLSAMGTEQTEVRAHDLFRQLLDDPRWLLITAEAKGELVGYAAAQDYGPHVRTGDAHRTARLHDVFVLTSHRRLGIGRTLMDAVVEWARTRVRHLEWQAHVERAAPFYEGLGYTGDPSPQPEYPYFEVTFDR